MTIAYISHQDCQLHEMGVGHPERPARLTSIEDALVSSGLDVALRHYSSPRVTRDQLLRVHASDYVDFVDTSAPASGMVFLDGDTAMNPHSHTAALRAAGAVVQAVDLVISGEVGAAFCNVRPPGHHAEHNLAMGFCIFNNVAVGAAHALENHGLQRIAIVDFDVHHGNGTEDIFRNDTRVLLCSSFQHPFYPYSGADTVSEHILNLPLPAGTTGEEFREAAANRWLDSLNAFQPEMVFISAGFDAHVEDEIGGLAFTERDYAWITHLVKEIADGHAGGRIVSVLEGGYALPALGRSVAAHIDALLGHG